MIRSPFAFCDQPHSSQSLLLTCPVTCPSSLTILVALRCSYSSMSHFLSWDSQHWYAWMVLYFVTLWTCQHQLRHHLKALSIAQHRLGSSQTAVCCAVFCWGFSCTLKGSPDTLLTAPWQTEVFCPNYDWITSWFDLLSELSCGEH